MENSNLNADDYLNEFDIKYILENTDICESNYQKFAKELSNARKSLAQLKQDLDAFNLEAMVNPTIIENNKTTNDYALEYTLYRKECPHFTMIKTTSGYDFTLIIKSLLENDIKNKQLAQARIIRHFNI